MQLDITHTAWVELGLLAKKRLERVAIYTCATFNQPKTPYLRGRATSSGTRFDSDSVLFGCRKLIFCLVGFFKTVNC